MNDVESMKAALVQMKQNLVPYPFPYMSGYVSTLGRTEHASLMITVSLTPKSTWPNDILQNSPHANFSIGRNGSMEILSRWKTAKFRKTKIKSVHDIITKLHVWAEKTIQDGMK